MQQVHLAVITEMPGAGCPPAFFPLVLKIPVMCRRVRVRGGQQWHEHRKFGSKVLQKGEAVRGCIYTLLPSLWPHSPGPLHPWVEWRRSRPLDTACSHRLCDYRMPTQDADVLWKFLLCFTRSIVDSGTSLTLHIARRAWPHAVKREAALRLITVLDSPDTPV